METDSKKRGRPSKFTNEEAATLRRRYPRVVERQRQNLFYAEKARLVLNRLIELHIEKDADEGRAYIDKHKWILHKPTILAELGRILGKDWNPRNPEAEQAWRLFLGAIGWLGETRPSTKRAVAVLRRHRTGKAKPATVNDLAAKIMRTVVEYRTAHPNADQGLILRALDAVENTVRPLEE